MFSIYDLSLIPGIISAVALILAWYFLRYVKKQDQGTSRMKDLQRYIREGAWTFMSEEVRVFAVVMFIIAGLLWGIFYWEV
ncbi:MAG: sodium/proton-translocating pyrophosphatase, partial [Candidatus Bipolaricaulota bacterium]